MKNKSNDKHYEDKKKSELSDTAGGNAKVQPLWKTVEHFFKRSDKNFCRIQQFHSWYMFETNNNIQGKQNTNNAPNLAHIFMLMFLLSVKIGNSSKSVSQRNVRQQ
jgi:hypothetical protein